MSIASGGSLDRKFRVQLPARVTSVILCRNPRCITSTGQELPQIFRLTDRKKRVYRCIYCESRAEGGE